MHQVVIIPLFLFLTATPDAKPSAQEEQVRCAGSEGTEDGDEELIASGGPPCPDPR